MAETKTDSKPENDATTEENLKEEVKSATEPVESKNEENKSEETKNEGDKSEETKNEETKNAEIKIDDNKTEGTENDNEKKSISVDAKEASKDEPSSELLAKIKKQVEFYFGDVNMQRDRFLIEQTRLDDGWVPMTVMLNFKMLASLSKDIEVILNALENSDLIEISEDKKKIRRSLSNPLPIYDDSYRKAQEARTVYLKGFPTDTKIETLKSHFEPLFPIENIIMRKYKKDKEYFFKGSIFLQFATLEDAKKFMDQESVKYNKVELIKRWSADYVASKEKEREERRQKKAKNQDNAKAEDNKESNKKNNVKDKVKLPKGCILHISNIKKGIKREEIKEKILELESEVAYIDYNNGDVEGWIRLQGENSAAELIKKLDSNMLKVSDCDMTCKLLEGEEEEAYLTKIQENMASHRMSFRQKGRNGKRGFKRRHSPHRDNNAKKTHLAD